ncbi:ferredoxin [Mangrovicoccus sp. HB161399]|uniref:ferredoxin n=1 Tax=Mangrovicoccus sp. HB161399 TaxID=2720392 RepID=UPI001557AA09|nr:ferredoxin [Mangrovicoccus sp. HB161399]
MYVILTTKPGEFRTEMTEGVTKVESWDYIFYGRKRANFVIARIEGAPRITIVEDAPPQIVNRVPSKLFESFDTLEEARAELNTLTHYGSMDIELRAAS